MPISDELLELAAYGYTNELVNGDIVYIAMELQELRKCINSAPLAMMDTREALGVCALKEEDFPALQALQGKKVRLVIDDDKRGNDEQANKSRFVVAYA